ncbi:type I 3-dehydroquinate dehydratase [Edaphovirga cremea]|jgi:3-dehydroquinate dehydratase-1|uniref:type I 3-dehydroquinate dehydratase n=1 Tax=Edaphovirga cremea TaxID=2267246 RepID=UPI000DF019F4|nr:type I 3-dehydroquinate dehydratase [Edaphovirga cremea]
MMNTVTVKNITFGEGAPRICVSLVGKTLSEIQAAAQELSRIDADVIEWRVDHFNDVEDLAAVKQALQEIRGILPEAPLLFTFRSREEGGERAISKDAYFLLNATVVATGLVDMIDVELFSDEVQIPALLAHAHQSGVKVIMSNHDFHKTPAKEEIIYRLRRMQELGADLPKIAVMPQSPLDVLTLLEATWVMKQEYATQPLITMSMGGTGVISRLAGQVFGSAMTFGAARQASAPGQIDVAKLRSILTLLDK